MVRNAGKSFVRENKFHSYLTREILPVEEKVSVFDDHGKTPSYQTFADGPMRKVTAAKLKAFVKGKSTRQFWSAGKL